MRLLYTPFTSVNRLVLITHLHLFFPFVSAWKKSLKNQTNIYVFLDKITGWTWGHYLKKKRCNLFGKVQGKV